MIAMAVLRALLLSAAARAHAEYPDHAVYVLARPATKGECSDTDFAHLHPCDIPASIRVMSSATLEPPPGAWVIYRGDTQGKR
jgi:hypothetical protein